MHYFNADKLTSGGTLHRASISQIHFLALNSQFGYRNIRIDWKGDQFTITILFIGKLALILPDLA